MTEDDVEEVLQSLGTLKLKPGSPSAEERAVTGAVSTYVESMLASLGQLPAAPHRPEPEELAIAGALASFQQAQQPAPAAVQQPVVGVPANDNWRRLRFAAAAMVLLAIGAAAGWGGSFIGQPRSSASIVVAEAANAYSIYGTSNTYHPAIGDTQVAVLDTWLSDRVKRKVTIEKLAPASFTLASAVLLPSHAAQGGSALELIFKNTESKSVAVYVTGAAPGTKPAREQVAHNGVDAFFWEDDRITCTIIGNLGAQDMQTVAAAFYQKLAQPGDPHYTGERV